MSDRFEPDAALEPWLRRLSHYQYVAELIEGRRVLEVGCGAGFGAQFVANLGAARVLGVDRSEPAIREANEHHRLTNLEFRVADPASLEIEDAAFDAVLVPDGAHWLRRRPVLEELRRVLARDGFLLFAADSADRPSAAGGVSYYDLLDRLEPLFAPVRMIARTPFVAESLVEYSGDETEPPDIELDTSLLDLTPRPDDDVVGYVALCGAGAERLSGDFTIVQMPPIAGVRALSDQLGAAPGPPRDSATQLAEEALARVRELQDALPLTSQPGEAADSDLRERLERAVEARDQLQRRVRELEQHIGDAQQEIGRVAADAGIEVSEARRELERMRERVRELEADGARPAGPTPSELIAEAMQAHAERVAQLEAVIDERSAYADELREQRDAARAEADAARARADELETEVAERAEQLRQWRSRASTAEGELLAARRTG